MVTIYYRKNEAILKKPIAFSTPEEGLDKDDYEFVHRLQDAPSLEDIFHMFNVINGDEIPIKLGVRSMMPGDVVVDEDGDVWFCAFSGWEKSAW